MGSNPVINLNAEEHLMGLEIQNHTTESSSELDQSVEHFEMEEQRVTQFALRNNMVPVQENNTNKRRAVEANQTSSPSEQ